MFLFLLQLFASLQLPRVLDSRSQGFDIQSWVQVVSAASDKLREVRHGQLHSEAVSHYF